MEVKSVEVKFVAKLQVGDSFVVEQYCTLLHLRGWICCQINLYILKFFCNYVSVAAVHSNNQTLQPTIWDLSTELLCSIKCGERQHA